MELRMEGWLVGLCFLFADVNLHAAFAQHIKLSVPAVFAIANGVGVFTGGSRNALNRMLGCYLTFRCNQALAQGC